MVPVLAAASGAARKVTGRSSLSARPWVSARTALSARSRVSARPALSARTGPSARSRVLARSSVCPSMAVPLVRRSQGNPRGAPRWGGATSCSVGPCRRSRPQVADPDGHRCVPASPPVPLGWSPWRSSHGRLARRQRRSPWHRHRLWSPGRAPQGGRPPGWGPARWTARHPARSGCARRSTSTPQEVDPRRCARVSSPASTARPCRRMSRSPTGHRVLSRSSSC